MYLTGTVGALCTQVPGSEILGSAHSPGPTHMDVPGRDRLPSGIIQTSSTAPHSPETERMSAFARLSLVDRTRIAQDAGLRANYP
jgi:hypothetical protein